MKKKKEKQQNHKIEERGGIIRYSELCDHQGLAPLSSDWAIQYNQETVFIVQLNFNAFIQLSRFSIRISTKIILAITSRVIPNTFSNVTAIVIQIRVSRRTIGFENRQVVCQEEGEMDQTVGKTGGSVTEKQSFKDYIAL